MSSTPKSGAGGVGNDGGEGSDGPTGNAASGEVGRLGLAGSDVDGAALKNSLDQRVSVAMSGSPDSCPGSGVTSAGISPVGVGVVMVLADLDIIE